MRTTVQDGAVPVASGIFLVMWTATFLAAAWWWSGGPARGSDLRYNMALSLEQAVNGDAVEIRIPVLAACEDATGLEQNRVPLLLSG